MVEGGKSRSLRAKLLETDRSLVDAIKLGKTQEELDVQEKSFSRPLSDGNSTINRLPNNVTSSSSSKKGFRCGKQGHFASDKSCPAWGKICSNCKKSNHFAVTCMKKSSNNKRPAETTDKKNKRHSGVNRVDDATTDKKQQDDPIDFPGVFHVGSTSTQNLIQIQIGGKPVKILIDSGAHTNMITSETFQTLKSNNAELQITESSPNRQFKCYGVPEGQNIVEVDLVFQALVEAGTHTSVESFCVARFGRENLLGQESALRLNLLRVGYEVQDQYIARLIDEFPKVPDYRVRIEIDKSVKPVAMPYRNVPLTLERLVYKKLSNLEDSAIIERVKRPPTWVSNVVPVQKANGDIRLCVDMRRANEAVKKESFPLGNIEQMLATIPKSACFSKIDLENAYFHFELEEDCRHITAFVTKRGIF